MACGVLVTEIIPTMLQTYKVKKMYSFYKYSRVQSILVSSFAFSINICQALKCNWYFGGGHLTSNPVFNSKNSSKVSGEVSKATLGN